ncbi:hypothetical protein ACRYCC_11615 [Actinomadura scrupuli]|uniref:hypothetical protein n=1 Tax=Actinomadura scrupuli TaxID=559629 RepID=UPI003D99AB32
MFSTTVKTVALGAAAAVALTACGGPVRLGAAAVVDGHRITTADLDRTVAAWQKQFAKDPAAAQVQQQAQQQGQQLPADPDSPPRSALAQLIGFRIWDEVAREQNVAVTPTEIDRIIAANGGQKAIQDQTLAGGLPVSHSRDLVRAFLIRSMLLQRFGAVPNGQGQVDQQTLQQAQQKLVGAQAQALRSMKIKVNPRYGSFDPSSGLGPVSYGLSKSDPGLNGAG